MSKIDAEQRKLRNLIDLHRREATELRGQYHKHVMEGIAQGKGPKAISEQGIMSASQAGTWCKLKGREIWATRNLSLDVVKSLAAEVARLDEEINTRLIKFIQTHVIKRQTVSAHSLQVAIGIGTSRYGTAMARARGEKLPKEYVSRPKPEPQAPARPSPNRFYKVDWASYGI